MRFPFLKRRRRIVITFVICFIALGMLVVAWALSDPLHSRARKRWKDQAIAEIEHRLKDKKWLDSEVSHLNAATAKNPYNGWVGDELLVTKNGEWIVCQNVCSKEQHTPVRRDLFIGRGSDGKWYYSTFHFCVGKCVLQMQRQPDTLAQFVDGYWLRPFDGKWDEALSETWNFGPWGDDKLRPASTGNGSQ
jgi:hypothetical protein